MEPRELHRVGRRQRQMGIRDRDVADYTAYELGHKLEHHVEHEEGYHGPELGTIDPKSAIRVMGDEGSDMVEHMVT